MNIIIIGSGAMGLLFYRQLSKDHQVTLLTRNRNSCGSVNFTFTNILGLSTQQKITFANKQSVEHADLVISTVKAYDVLSALKQTALSNTVPIILMHNGMGTFEEIEQHFSNPMLQLLTTQASKQHAVFHIQHTGVGNNQLGGLNSAGKSISASIFNGIQQAIPNLMLTDKVIKLQWQKLAINCAINPLTAIDDISNGGLMDQKYRETIENITGEVVQVALAEGIKLSIGELLKVIYQVINDTQLNSSSMRQDVIHKRTTEIDYINGYIIKMGLKHHVPTPFNKKIHQQINSL